MTFRIKARIPEALLKQHLQYVKTGVPGVTYVRTDINENWPDFLKVSSGFLTDKNKDKVADSKNRIK